MKEDNKQTENQNVEESVVESSEIVDNQNIETSQNSETNKDLEVEAKSLKTKSKKIKKEVVIENFEGLSDDEIYAKLQTEKMLKAKQTKKLATLIGMCFSFVLAVILIVLASVPVSLKPSCIDDGFASIAMYPGSSSQGVAFSEGEEGYDKSVELYNKSFGQSYISALFSGSLLSYDIEEKLKEPSTIIGPDGELNKNGIFYIRLRYSEERVLSYRNGKQYVSNIGNTARWPDGKLTFTDVYIVVNQTAGFQDTKVYFIANYPTFDENGNKQDKTEARIVTVTLKANTYQFYDAWEDLNALNK